MAHRSSRWHIFVVLFLVFGGVTIGGASLRAQTGSATSAAIPMDPTPNIGDQLEVEISIDVSGVDPPDNALGSFTASLAWDPAVLAYDSDSGVLAGFTGVVNSTNAASGHLIFNGAKVTGVTGNVTVLNVTFDVVGEGSSDLDLEYAAMSAALTFANLLPLLTVNDGQVEVGPAYESAVFLPIVRR